MSVSAASQAKPKRRREKLMFRVAKGALVPADTYTVHRLRQRRYGMGDLVSAELTKSRSPGFHRLAHRIGMLCARNIEAFSGLEAHDVLKRLQIEGNIGCDEIFLQLPGVGPCSYRVPRSLSFESMEQGEFYEVDKAFCRYIASTYWKGMDPEAIEEMAESFVEEA